MKKVTVQTVSLVRTTSRLVLCENARGGVLYIPMPLIVTWLFSSLQQSRKIVTGCPYTPEAEAFSSSKSPIPPVDFSATNSMIFLFPSIKTSLFCF
jgi:hypothetical protein